MFAIVADFGGEVWRQRWGNRVLRWGWAWLRRAFAASARGDWVMRFIVVVLMRVY